MTEASNKHVKMCNCHLKEFKCLGTVYQKGAVQVLRDLQTIGVVVTKLVYLDLMLNLEYTGRILFHVPHAARTKSAI